MSREIVEGLKRSRTFLDRGLTSHTSWAEYLRDGKEEPEHVGNLATHEWYIAEYKHTLSLLDSFERLLADERVRGGDALVELIKKTDALLIVEREKVREMCACIAESCDVSKEAILAYDNRQDIALRAEIAEAIRQLDLTAPMDEGGEEKVNG